MNKIVTTLVAAMLFMVSATYSQTSLTLTPSVVNGNTGETITVEVVAANFPDIVSMQYGIVWDPAVLQYSTVGDFNLKDLDANVFNADQDNGFLTLAWSDRQAVGVPVADGVLFSISFTVLGDASSGTTIAFGGRQGLPIEIIDSNSSEITNSVERNDSQFGDPNGNNTGGNSSPLISSISDASGDNGTTVCVNVSVSNFTDITAMEYSLNWDANALQFTEVKNINLTGLSQSSFGTSNTASGQLTVDWANSAGASTTNGTNIYQVCYNLLGASGTSSSVSFSGTPTPISVTTTSTSSVGITQNNGTVSVNTETVTPPTGGTSLVNIGTIDAEAGSTVCVPITVNDFDGLAALQFSLQWDNSVLQFSEVKNFNIPELTASNFNTTQSSDGRLALAWFDNAAVGIDLADGTTIFELCFTVLGASGTSSGITFSNVPTAREAATANATITFTETNGAVTVDGGTAPPPPSSAGDKLVNVGAVNTPAGSTVCVPITVNDFDGIASLQFSLEWDPAVLQFDEVQGFNLPDLSAGNFNIEQVSSGRIAVAWFDNAAVGINRNDGATIFELCFTALGATNTSTNIVFSDNPTAREAATANNTITFTETNGSVSIGDGTPPPPPPPPAADQLVNIGTVSAPAGSTVCVPVTVSDFNGIASLQFSLAWDPTVLQYSGVENFNLPDLSASNFNSGDIASGRIAVAWFDNAAQGVTLTDGATVFEICFTVSGAIGTNSTIIFTDVPTAREAATANNTITFTETNGSVTVTDGTINPPPPTGDGILNIGALSGPVGSTICVPITAKDFDGIAAMQFSLAWDPSVLEYTSTQSFGLPDLSAASFNVGGTANGQIAVAWFDNAAQGIDLADGATVFEICFTVIGTNGQSTSISFTDMPTARELATSTGTIDFESSDGTFTVGTDTPQGDGILNIGNLNALPGSTICVPITAKDFDGIAAMQFSLGWDPSVLEYTSTQSFGLPDLSAASFNTAGTANGQIAVAWFDNAAQGIDLVDGATVFEVCFTVVGTDGESTSIRFTDTPTARELATSTGTIDFESSDGTFTVGEPDEPVGSLVNIAATTVNAGESVCIPVTVNDFNGLAALQFSLGWDPSVLTYTGVQSFGLPDFNANSFNVAGAANGAISAVWTDNTAQGITLDNGTTIFEICFTASSTEGSTLLAFTDNPTSREAATPNNTVPFTSSNGLIMVDAGMPCPTNLSAIPGNPTNVTCNGANNGALTITATGGDGNYTYAWSDPSIGNIPNPTGLAAGIYTVTVSGCGGQEVSNFPVALLTITEPPAIVAVITPQDASCFGEADGRINVSIQGGTVPYSYEWSDPLLAPLNRPVNAQAGSYSLTITDGNGCEDVTQNVVVASPSPISATVSSTPASCSGMPDGTALIEVTGGSGSGYTFDWGDASITGANPTNVPAATYVVTITDTNNCTSETTVTVDATIVLSGTTQVIEDACGDSKGAIQITPTGGTGPYAYNWSGPATIGDVATAENIPTGTYNVTVTDANGCFFTLSDIEVGGPTATLSASATVNNVDCPEDSNGSIAVTATGGFSPYTYAWSNDATTATISDLVPGAYTVTISDAKVCTYTETFTVGSTSNLAIEVTILKGAPNGSASVTATGGVEPYQYEWCNGQITQTATNLDEGVCSVTVIDALGCTRTATVTILVDNPEVTISIPNPIGCTGATNGILQAEIALGTGAAPFTYAWSTGTTGNLLLNIGAGNYTVTVTDANGNEGVGSINFEEPTPVTIDLIENVAACQDVGGSIEISLSGGTGSYDIAWSNGVQDALKVEGLLPGEYGVIVTDGNDCTSEENFRIVSQPECTEGCYTSLKIMTPNDDGRNDAFFINCSDLAKNNHLSVYNRWGQLVFEADNYSCILGTESDCWQGRTKRGQLVDEGGYFWVFEFDDTNGRTRIKDHVTIMNDN